MDMNETIVVKNSEFIVEIKPAVPGMGLGLEAMVLVYEIENLLKEYEDGPRAVEQAREAEEREEAAGQPRTK